MENMIILLSENKSLIREIKKIDSVQIAKDVFDCYTYLTIPDVECDILILDYELIKEQYELLFTWIIERNLFIRAIVIYCKESLYDDKNLQKKLKELNKAKYANAIINIEILLESIRRI
jgi:hypothetical protein